MAAQTRSRNPLGLHGVPDSHHNPSAATATGNQFRACGSFGVMIQLLSTALLMGLFKLEFRLALPVAVITAASSNYLVNNASPFETDARAAGN